MGYTTPIHVLKLAMLAILIGWACLWVLKPTKSWKSSWRSVEDSTKGTFLGDYGLDILIFCFPILSVAILGYVYQHLLQNKRLRQKNGNVTWIKFSNPMIVHSPIGIITGGEILVVSLFASLMVWTLYRNISTDFGKLAPQKALHLNKSHLKAMKVGIRFGTLTEICMAVLFLPILRGMALFKMIGIQFEASVKYHVWIGNTLILFSMLHGIIIMFIWADSHSFWSEISKWQRTGRVNVAGAITLTTGLAIWITSLPAIRRKQFHLFYLAHHLYIIFTIFYLFHCGDRHFHLVLPGILLFALDKILRSVQSRPTPCLISARLLPCKAIELTLSKHASMRYNPTSVLLLNVPSISKFHWHPFSIITNTSTDNDRVSMIIKCHGWWTNTLYDKIQSMAGSEEGCSGCLPIAVEGPYGPSENLIKRYDCLILVAGGSGINPLLSIMGEVLSRKTNTHSRISKVHLIYAVKRTEELSMLTPISSLLLKQQPTGSTSQLKLKAFVTREEISTRTSPSQVLQDVFQMQTKSVHPKPPIDFAQLPVGLLPKAVITGLSSLIFLMMLVILSHIFLPRNKKGAGGTYPSWINDLLVITSLVVAICSAVIGTVSITKFAKKDPTAISLELVRTGCLFSDEVTDNIAEEHEVYFGKRPNLEDLLEDLSTKIEKPSKVGVFVSGPNAMQHSVAAFCRKHSTTFDGNSKIEKPHFTYHSLSFSL